MRQNAVCGVAQLRCGEHSLVDQHLRHRSPLLIAVFAIGLTQQPGGQRDRVPADKARRVAPFLLILAIREQPAVVIVVRRRAGEEGAVLPAGDVRFRAVHCFRRAVGQPVRIQPADVRIRPLRHVGERVFPVPAECRLLRAEQAREHGRGLGARHGLFQLKSILRPPQQAEVAQHLRLRLGVARVAVVDRPHMRRARSARQRRAAQNCQNQFFHAASLLSVRKPLSASAGSALYSVSIA